jgi:hypothetical protein
VEAQGKWLRVVRWAAMAALVGLLALLPPAAFAAAKQPEGPSYVLSNLAAFIMCVVAIAIPCKRYHRG